MDFQISVVIGTYDRARILEGALEALAAQEVPDRLKWEILIVDNNSKDSTAQTVAAFSRTTPTPVRYVVERRQGIASARNRGVLEARGAIVAFTDDDVLAAPDWIAQIAAAFDRWNADGVGGRILPKWEVAPPRWLTGNRNLLDRLAIMDFASGQFLELPAAPRPQVWGANMAFRREALERIGKFDPRRGVIGKKLYRGEEDDLIRRALRLGLKIAYDPAITVTHRIGSDRVRRGYFRKLFFDAGQGRALVEPEIDVRSFLGAPLPLYRLPLSVAKWICLVVLRRPGAFEQQLGCFWLMGQLSGYWRRDPGPQPQAGLES